MRRFHGGTDFQKKREPLGHWQCFLLDERCHRHARHVVHHKIGRAILARARVDQPRNVGMIQPRQNLALRAEPSHQLFVVEIAPQHLDGHLFFEITVGARRQVDRAHAAFPDFTHEHVSPNATADFRDALARNIRAGGLGTLLNWVRPVLQECLRFGQQRAGFAKHFRIARAQFLQNFAARRRTIVLQGLGQDGLEPLPPRRVQRPPRRSG